MLDDLDDVEDSPIPLSPNDIGSIINLIKKEFYNSFLTIGMIYQILLYWQVYWILDLK